MPELYDPSSGLWTTTGSMNTTRQYHTTTLIKNGKVLVAGGSNDYYLNSAELYDPSSGHVDNDRKHVYCTRDSYSNYYCQMEKC